MMIENNSGPICFQRNDHDHVTRDLRYDSGGVLPMMAYTGRLRPKGVLFSGLRYMKNECEKATICQ